ncbi:type VI secretion system protein TssA [Aporhodopirellula aestuarii]|uniref:Type VI secretion system protein TssA n=1 Tax=Aporhodopirellula aestuarii TaxID=2950107 RepID=A0ABT0TZ99_9BACT|nr:type VI secretion system protein TssA [Aporhodopirellula aestuarii]MCM2369882.1 type VI secretion system protein TssA [Aporhodopirellula aestuarii]
MSSLDLESLLTPVSDDEPSGQDLEYDLQAVALDQAVKGKQEQQFGDTIIEAEEPDWKTVHKLAVELLARTKDLRIAVHLANASLAVGGLAEFRDVASLIESYLTDFWSSVHPVLDADDDDDPTERVNAVASLRDPSTTLRLLKQSPLIQVPGIGPITLMDLEIARGDIAAPEGGDPPISMSTIDGAFQGCDVNMLRETLSVVSDIRQKLSAIESAITSKVGVSQAVSLDPIVDVVTEIEGFVQGYLQKRQVDSSESAESESEAVSGETPAAAESVPAQPVGCGEIRKREDVIRAIDRICDYYEKYEPSSPLPLLLNRAKRLVTASFMEIIQDLTPDALQQAEQIGGGRSDD